MFFWPVPFVVTLRIYAKDAVLPIRVKLEDSASTLRRVREKTFFLQVPRHKTGKLSETTLCIARPEIACDGCY